MEREKAQKRGLVTCGTQVTTLMTGLSGTSSLFDDSGGYFYWRTLVKDREGKELPGTFCSGYGSASKITLFSVLHQRILFSVIEGESVTAKLWTDRLLNQFSISQEQIKIHHLQDKLCRSWEISLENGLESRWAHWAAWYQIQIGTWALGGLSPYRKHFTPASQPAHVQHHQMRNNSHGMERAVSLSMLTNTAF